jgi:hypothetical protein
LNSLKAFVEAEHQRETQGQDDVETSRKQK